MSESLLICSVPVAIAFHNLEEAIWLPRSSEQRGGRWHRSVGAWSFRFAVATLTVLAFLVAALAQFGGWESFGHCLLASYALGQALNVFLPHAVATIAARVYAPGLLTGILFVLPSAFVFLSKSFTEEYVQPTRFFVIAAIFIPRCSTVIGKRKAFFLVAYLIYCVDHASLVHERGGQRHRKRHDLEDLRI